MRNLLKFSMDGAPHMPISYHEEFVRIATDMIRLEGIKEKMGIVPSSCVKAQKFTACSVLQGTKGL